MKLPPKFRPVAGRKIDAVAIVTRICIEFGRPDYVEHVRGAFVDNGIARALELHDNEALYDWLMECFNYQGVSDRSALSYLETHGKVGFRAIKGSLIRAVPCPKLAAFDAFVDCGFGKLKRRCNNPGAFSACPLPKHTMRKGALNQAAYSLYLFMRDRSSGDLVTHIDRVLEQADRLGHPDRLQMMCEALVAEFQRVYGISSKVIQMTLADLLMAADRSKTRWIETGASMIAIDSLVHNFLHRSGVLYATQTSHLFGPACFRSSGCLGIIDRISRKIDARQFNGSFPSYFPRFVQHSLWAFCAQNEFGICNGVTIDDRERCRNKPCPMFSMCGRVALTR